MSVGYNRPQRSVFKPLRQETALCLGSDQHGVLVLKLWLPTRIKYESRKIDLCNQSRIQCMNLIPGI